jgi:hypothetical protein
MDSIKFRIATNNTMGHEVWVRMTAGIEGGSNGRGALIPYACDTFVLEP